VAPSRSVGILDSPIRSSRSRVLASRPALLSWGSGSPWPLSLDRARPQYPAAMKRGTRRLITKLTLCTLAGAVVTWAVAWGCALWGPGTDQKEVEFREAGRWPVEVPAAWGSFPGLRMEETTPVRHSTSWCSVAPQFTSKMVTITEVGWPVRSMAGVTRSRHRHESLRDTTVRAPKWMRPNQHCDGIPTRILPVGFAINTLFAMGLLLGLVEGLAFARRRARRAKGLCPSCGYDRGGLAKDAACPECGGTIEA
jgi:hypothetical protein